MRVLLISFIGVCLLLPLTERIRVRTALEIPARREIAEVEARLASAVRERDHPALERLISREVRVVDANGELLNGARPSSAARPDSRWYAVEIRRPDVRVYDAIALVHGRATVRGQEVYILRIWANVAEAWQLVVAHTTDITEHATSEPPAFATLRERIRPRETDDVPDESAEEEDVKRALRESHQRYWAKNVPGYVRTVGSDLIRVAETGVRPGVELVDFMRNSPHLPRPPSHQLEMWAKVFGSVAIGGWLDSGTTAQGATSLNRFTLALVWRDGRWQIVQMQSTGVDG